MVAADLRGRGGGGRGGVAQQGDGRVTVGSFNVPHIGETHTCQTSPGSGGEGGECS